MLNYYITNTSIPIELCIVSGGISVTGAVPYVEIRNKGNGFYYDFTTRTFNAAPVSSTGTLTSAVDGFYRFAWDVSALFTTDTFLTYEFHARTAVAIEEVIFTKPAISTADISLTYGGGPAVEVKGVWTGKQKKKLFDLIESVKDNVKSFKKDAFILLRKILSKKTLQKEDLAFITHIREEHNNMWQEIKKPLLKMLELKDTASLKDVMEKLRKYNEIEEKDKREILSRIDEIVEIKKDIEPKPEDIVDDEDDE